ncbi:MAG TPA: isochorismatase family protein [bacterium]|nr:isochorismatase family protein [bacterium]
MTQPQAIIIGDDDALSVTDVQVDFLPGGALAVADGDAVIPPLNRAIALFRQRHRPVIFTRDWHPADHCSFAAQGGAWPPHCIQHSPGAAFSPLLTVPGNAVVVSKATHQNTEEYSTFRAHDTTGITERELLRHYRVRRIFIGGLATEYCILNTVRDALHDGFAVYVLTDAIRPVEVSAGDSARALAEMQTRGAHLLTTTELS